MSTLLEGRVAVVTGGGRGIGRAIAMSLAAQKAFVIVASRTTSEIEETARLVGEVGGQASFSQVDVADHESVSILMEQVLRTHGRIDILVNNAGIQGPIGPLVTNDWRAWQQNINVNLVGTFNCCYMVLPAMINRRAGKIVNLSGGGATAPRPNFSAYAAAKAAVVRLTETLAEEVREYNIQVNAVAPGAVNTRMLDEVLQAGKIAGLELEAAQRRMQGGGTPPDVAADLVTFLASDASNGLTGKLIAAPFDNWRQWDDAMMRKLSSTPWLSLRRIDPYTLTPLTEDSVAECLEDSK